MRPQSFKLLDHAPLLRRPIAGSSWRVLRLDEVPADRLNLKRKKPNDQTRAPIGDSHHSFPPPPVTKDQTLCRSSTPLLPITRQPNPLPLPRVCIMSTSPRPPSGTRPEVKLLFSNQTDDSGTYSLFLLTQELPSLPRRQPR